MVPKVLPFIGVAAEPVAHEDCIIRRMSTDVGDDFDALFIIEMRQRPE